MGAKGRLCLCCLVVVVNFQWVTNKPMFGTRMWCDLLCDDDYDSASSTSSLEDLFDALWDPCTDCQPRRPSTTTPNPMMQQRPYNFVITPSTGLNLTLTSTGGLLNMNFVPWPVQPATPMPPLVPASVAPAPAAAANVTAAVGANATVATGANATVAAGANSTAPAG